MNLTLKYLVCFIAFLSSFESQSQNFINPGAEWNSSGYVVDGASFTEFINYKYQNDTTIQGLTYQIIKKKGKSIHYFPSIAVSEYSLGSFLLRSSGDSLFYSRIDSVEEHLLYDFSPVIGNTWDVFPILEGIFYPPTTSQLVQTTGFGDTLINPLCG